MAHSALPYISFLSSFSLKKHPAYKRVFSLYRQLTTWSLPLLRTTMYLVPPATPIPSLWGGIVFFSAGRFNSSIICLPSSSATYEVEKRVSLLPIGKPLVYQNIQIQNRCGWCARAAISSACWMDLTDPFPSLLEIWCSILGLNAYIVSGRVVEGGRSIAACYLELGEKASALCLWQGRYLLAID